MSGTSATDETETARTVGGPQLRSRAQNVAATAKRRYEGSWLEDLWDRLQALDFFDNIILFGASLLLSVLPFVILVSTFANHRIDSDLDRHLGLSDRGATIVSGLFKTSHHYSYSAIVTSFLIGLIGTIAVARSLQKIYEKLFVKAYRGLRNLVRLLVWLVVAGAIVVSEAALNWRILSVPGGRVLAGAVTLVALSTFFAWTMHYLMHGDVPWSQAIAPAVFTAVFWIGLGVFASFYFSSTIVSDSSLYGTIGVVFSLMTWFIAICAVIVLGAVGGVVFEERRAQRQARVADN